MSKRSAKRRLSEITFDHVGAHLALVSKDQGGPANGYDKALVMKSAKNFSPDIIEKMQQIRVTLELPEFLQRFFDMWCDDAEVLARMLGWEPKADGSVAEDQYYRDYIESRLESFEILKAMYEGENLADVVSSLDEDTFLSVLRDQESVEKAMAAKEEPTVTQDEGEVGDLPEESQKATSDLRVGQFVCWDDKDGNTIVGKVEKTSKARKIVVPGSDFEVKAVDGDPAILVRQFKQGSEGWMPTDTFIGKHASALSKVKATQKSQNTETNTKEVTMSKEAAGKAEITVDVIEKSKFEAVQKANNDLKASLNKALEEIETFKAQQKETVRKARRAALGDVVADADNADTLFKALDLIEDDAVFIEVLNVLKAMSKVVDNSNLTEELGASSETAPAVSNSLADLLKSQYHANKD